MLENKNKCSKIEKIFQVNSELKKETIQKYIFGH